MPDFYDLNGFPEKKTYEKLGWSKVIKPIVICSKNIQQEVRRIRAKADVIIAMGDEALNRMASECWEVDIIGSPEIHNGRDFMHQANSGIDRVIALACAERGIAVELNFSNILGSHGRKRAQILSRMAQNVRICRDCGCDMVITSGSRDKYGLRVPRDLMAFGILLGMTTEEARAAVSTNPQKILKRTEDRNNPDIILKGLEVKKWGSQKKQKKIYGWY